MIKIVEYWYLFMSSIMHLTIFALSFKSFRTIISFILKLDIFEEWLEGSK